MKSEFKKNNFLVLKNVIHKDLINFIYNYFLMKRNVAKTLFETNYISPFNTDWGYWKDEQVPNSYSHYADIVMETLLLKIQPIMEKETGLKLNPTYSYARIYKNGDILERHKDRFSCEISITLNLGGDKWPIYLEPSGEIGKKGIKVDLNPGDLLIYKGNILEHWREKFDGENCGQVFLHYNDVKSTNSNENIFDGRPHLGLPSYFKVKKWK